MTSDDSLSLILRRLDEIERKLLDRMMEGYGPQLPSAIRYAGAIFQGRTEATGLDGTISALIPRWYRGRDRWALIANGGAIVPPGAKLARCALRGRE